MNRLYDISTLVPAIVLGICALFLIFGYDLSKSKLKVMRKELSEVRANEKTVEQ